jgi:hypothetical protein
MIITTSNRFFLFLNHSDCAKENCAMKLNKTLCVFLTLISPFLLFGQDLNIQYGDSNAVWVYNYSIVPAVTRVKANGDTIVNGRKLKIFEKTQFERKSSAEIMVFPLPPLYVFTESGIVEFSTDLIHFDTLYNFQLNIGESWTIPQRNNSGMPTGIFSTKTVVDTFSLFINGRNVYCQSVMELPDSFMDTVYPVHPRDTIYQSIGSRRRYVLPFDYLDVATDSGEGGVLRCFNDDNIGLVEYVHPYSMYGDFFSDSEYDCDQISSISSIPTSNTYITVFPNPASNIIHIQSDRKDIRSLIFYNLQGVPILEKQGHGDTLDLDISDIPSGMYFVLINGSYFEKVILER